MVPWMKAVGQGQSSESGVGTAPGGEHAGPRANETLHNCPPGTDVILVSQRHPSKSNNNNIKQGEKGESGLQALKELQEDPGPAWRDRGDRLSARGRALVRILSCRTCRAPVSLTAP